MVYRDAYEMAMQLLTSALTEDQLNSFKSHNYIRVVGLSGLIYRVRPMGYVQLAMGHEDGRGFVTVWGLCINPLRMVYPTPDQMYTLVRLLQSKGGENYVFNKGNLVKMDRNNPSYIFSFTDAVQNFIFLLYRMVGGYRDALSVQPDNFRKSAELIEGRYGREAVQRIISTILITEKDRQFAMNIAYGNQ